MIITGMEHFQNVCKKKLVEWYNTTAPSVGMNPPIDLSNVFVVWSCKALQNYKALLSTTVSGDGIYAEYTYNGDKQELYGDIYKKLTNTCIKEENNEIDTTRICDIKDYHYFSLNGNYYYKIGNKYLNITTQEFESLYEDIHCKEVFIDIAYKTN